MQPNLNVSIAQWEHIDFSVDDEGAIVVRIVGNFPDPEHVSKRQALEIFNGPFFHEAVTEAFMRATGPLRDAFDRQQDGQVQMRVEFENTVTLH